MRGAGQPRLTRLLAEKEEFKLTRLSTRLHAQKVEAVASASSLSSRIDELPLWRERLPPAGSCSSFSRKTLGW
jgi:hypothetical protein